MKRIISLSACLVILSFTVQAADLYRWVDSRGIVHYSDMPSPDAEKLDPRKFSDQVVPGEDLPYGTRIARQNFPVTLYVGSGCGDACDQAHSLLNKRGIPYAEKTLRTREEIDAFKKLTGSEIVPTLAVGKSYLKGLQSEQWHGELDIAGYPKIAPYRAPNTEPPAAEKPAEPAPEIPDVEESPATP
ncbi:MAG: glutaredoxin family protein [Pseudomonadota bacterium]